MWPTILLVIYCLLIASASLGGGILSSLIKINHTHLQILMSLVGGLILGVALLHMLPHAIAYQVDIDLLMAAMLAGILAMFFLMRAFHIHYHEPVEPTDGTVHDGHAHDHCREPHSHVHAHQHAHDLPAGPESADQTEGATTVPGLPGGVSWLGLAVGFSLHTVMDGVALAASVQLAARDHAHFELVGIGIFLAILLHKPLDAMSITWMARASNWSRAWLWSTNALFALMCPLGALLCFFGFSWLGDSQTKWVAVALAFSAGVFICISLSDILPEVSFHSHDRAALSVALVLGVVLAWSISFLEPDHSHSHETHSTEPAGASTAPSNPSRGLD